MIDLALIMTTDLQVGKTPIHQIKQKPSNALWVRYSLNGIISERRYGSVLPWRTKALNTLEADDEIIAHEIDEWGRLKSIFPVEIKVRLDWNATQKCDPLPVTRLFDPHGSAEMILTRSRCRGHAVDVLHNLMRNGPMFQPVWVADILWLHRLAGIKLVRDEAFNPTMPSSAYIEAAAMTGKMVTEPELSGLPLTGIIPRLPSPTATSTVSKIFEWRCQDSPVLARLLKRTIYEDYVS